MKAYLTSNNGEQTVKSMRRFFVSSGALSSFFDAVYESTGMHFTDIYSILFSEENKKVIVEKKDDILRKIPRTYRKSIRHLIDFLVESDKILQYLLSGKGGVRELVEEYILYITGKTSQLDINKIGKTLGKIVPVPVLRNTGSIGYALKPGKRDTYMEGVLKLLEKIVERTISLDIDRKTVKVFGKEIRFERKEDFLVVLLKYGDEEKAKKYIEEIVREILSNTQLQDYLKGVWINTWECLSVCFDVHVELEPSILGESLVKQLEGEPLLRLTISTASAPEYRDASIHVTLDSKLVDTYLLLRVKLSSNNFEDKIREKIGEAIEKMKSTLEYIVPKLLDIKKIAREKGYRYVNLGGPDYTDKPSYTILLEKKSGKNKIEVWITNRGIQADIERPVKKYYEKIDTFLEEKFSKEKLPVENVVKLDTGGSRLSIRTKTYSLEEYREALEVFDKILEAVEEGVGEYTRLIEEKKKSLKMSYEDYVTIYLLWEKYLDWGSIEDTGRPRHVVYRQVARLLKKIAPEEYGRWKKLGYSDRKIVEEQLVDVPGILVRKGYIKLTPKGEILVNNKPLRKIAVKLGLPLDEAEETLLSIIMKYYRTSIFEPAHKVLELEELLTPEVIGKLIERKIFPYPSFKVIRRVWDKLSEKQRKEYIMHASLGDIKEIINNSDFSKKITGELKYALLSRIVREARELVVDVVEKKAPEIIGGVKYEAVRGIDFSAFKIGDYLITLMDLAGDSGNWFAVFREDTGKGIVVRAYTVREAYEKALREYDKLMMDLEVLRKLEKEMAKNKAKALMEENYIEVKEEPVSLVNEKYKLMVVQLPLGVRVPREYYKDPYNLLSLPLQPGLLDFIVEEFKTRK